MYVRTYIFTFYKYKTMLNAFFNHLKWSPLYFLHSSFITPMSYYPPSTHEVKEASLERSQAMKLQ